MESISEQNIRLTADVVALSTRADGELCVLLIRRRWDPFVGQWALPGGLVELDEETHAAAAREFREETGLDVEHLTEVGMYTSPGRDPRGRYITVAYVTVVHGVPDPVAGDDAGDARWWPVSEPPAEGLAFDHRKILADAIAILAVPL